MDSRVELIVKLTADHGNTRYVSANEAGALLGLSKEYFLRLFHAQTGIRFTQYIREAKMMRAGKLMQDRTLPIKQIAHDLGYTDISNFYRDFKETHRMNPFQFRKAYLLITPHQARAVLPRPTATSTAPD